MPELSLLAMLAFFLFALTSALMLLASRLGPTLTGRVIALSSIATVAVACTTMLLAYEGEQELVFERPGPLKRTVVKDRGTFEYEDKEVETGRSNPSRNGSGQTAAGHNDADDDGGTSGLSGVVAQLRSASIGKAQGIRPGSELRDCHDCPDLVVVQPGYFVMGAAPGDLDAAQSELPRRTVSVPRRFAIGRGEVTVAQYMAFVRETGRAAPSCSADAGAPDQRMPVACVSWHDAADYAAWLSIRTSRTYRLPTEAEWEWAARGGSGARYFTGEALEQRSLNQFGLAQVHGSVAEMVAGCWSDSLRGLSGDARRVGRFGDCRRRVLRDAAASEPQILKRVSVRRPILVDDRRPQVGFRIARDI